MEERRGASLENRIQPRPSLVYATAVRTWDRCGDREGQFGVRTWLSLCGGACGGRVSWAVRCDGDGDGGWRGVLMLCVLMLWEELGVQSWRDRTWDEKWEDCESRA